MPKSETVLSLMVKDCFPEEAHITCIEDFDPAGLTHRYLFRTTLNHTFTVTDEDLYKEKNIRVFMRLKLAEINLDFASMCEKMALQFRAKAQALAGRE